ncbi:hypothetical protein IMSHALPRED_002312 [Imshaugia aleurites]|uniref:Uncharacterized protein n=1 Tax=Imshaugia aleurites TaxID=172621 RepID=A0A8H3IGM3_9LECA|nr:hypothetical protein IMSHALPRED_002312 [Imshaugia aleurites]
MPAPEEPSDADVIESDVEDLSGDSQDATADDGGSSMNPDGREDVGEWQDERCLQPIQRTPGVSPLCNACKHIFSECPSFGVVRTKERSGVASGESGWLRFLRSLQVLELSAQNGCAFCKLVFARIRRDRAEFRPAKAVRIKFQLFLVDDPSTLYLWLTHEGHTWPGSTAIRSNYKDFIIMDGTGA